MKSPYARVGALGAAALLAAAALTACGGGADTNSAGGTWPGDGDADCSGLEQLADFGDLTGKTVVVQTSITDAEGDSQKESYALFTQCTGAQVDYQANKDFEGNVLANAAAGNLPDIAYIDQPGLLVSLIDTGSAVEAPGPVEENVDKYWTEDWKNYGSVDGTFYAAPLGANVKSFVWYSPSMFQEHGWTIPETWDDLMTLTQTIKDAGITPWCAGFESGTATGWPGTDWIEEVVLRTGGPDVYDQWVNHEIPFNDPKIVEAFDTVGAILKNPDYVNGGIGDVKSIATTAFGDSGLPILDGECALHQMASFYGGFFDPDGTKGVKVAEDGDVFAFYEPPINDDFGKPVEGAGEFVVAFNDNPVTQAFQTFLSTDVWANAKAKATPSGGWVSANNGLDPANLVSPIDKLSAEILADKDATFRFDGSDAMPAAVGTGTFWTEMVNWISGQSTQDTVDNIEASWPAQ